MSSEASCCSTSSSQWSMSATPLYTRTRTKTCKHKHSYLKYHWCQCRVCPLSGTFFSLWHTHHVCSNIPWIHTKWYGNVILEMCIQLSAGWKHEITQLITIELLRSFSGIRRQLIQMHVNVVYMHVIIAHLLNSCSLWASFSFWPRKNQEQGEKRNSNNKAYEFIPLLDL